MYKELNKEQWLTVRKSQQLPAELVMEYCNKTVNAGFKNVEHFINAFNEAIHIGHSVGIPRDFSCVYKYFDRKYSVVVLRDKDGKEIIAL